MSPLVVDEALLLGINALRAPWLDAVLAPLSAHGVYAFPLVMLFALRGGASHAASIRDGWLTWFLAIFVAERVLKPLVGRLRPTAHEPLREALDVMGRVPPPTSLAFPSGTATAAFAAATWIWRRWGWKPGLPALLLAGVVGFSRVYGGVHWPTDIVGGAVLGAAIAAGLDWLAARVEASRRG